MTMFSIKCILLIFSTFIICCKCQSENPVTSSWAKLQISPDTLSSMEYGNFLIEIYEHVNNHKGTTTASQKKYFYSPLSLLDHKSAESLYNRITKKPEMRFRIEMWNDKIQNEVVKHLNEIVGQEIKSNQVRVIPLEKVILTSNVPTEDYSLSSMWTNYDKRKILRLSLTCFDQKVCDEMANEMKSDPEQFGHLKLLYSLSSQTWKTKQTTISIDSVTSGSMVSKLLQKFGDKNEIFLTANDEKKMLTEMTTNIRMETFDDSEVASPDTENQISNILKEMLITSRTTIKDQSDKMWDSVFWNEDNYRPDKTTKTLNEILNKLDGETQKKLADLFQKAERQSEENEKRIQHNYDANSWTDVDRISSTISGKLANDSDNSRKVESSKEDVEKLLQESRNHVQWDGEKFVPKPMQLSRINLGKFRDSQSFQDRNVRVRYASAELSAPIKFIEHAELAVADERNNLKDELKATAELLNTTIGELSSVKLDLTNTRIDLATAVMKFGEMNNELIKVKRNFTIKLEATSELLNTTLKNLGEMNEELNNVKTDLTQELLNTTVTDLWVKTSGELSSVKSDLAAAVMKLGEMNSELINKSEATSELLNTTVKNLVKTNEELNNVKTDLTHTTNTLKGTEQELNITQIELEKTKSNLSKNVDDLVDLSKTLKGTENDLAKLQTRIGNMSIELKTISIRLAHERKVNEGNLRDNPELRATSINLETTIANLNETRMELSSTKSAVADLTKMLNDRTSEIVDIGRMPTSCADIQRMGHKLSGFFSVKGSKKMEMIFCDFNPNQNDKQKWIGYADVKSALVHFYVQRGNSFATAQTPIPFDLAVVNEGNAMNLTSGIFTAPRPGIYFFSFTGLAEFPASSSIVSLEVILYLNGGRIGRGWVEDKKTVAYQRSRLTVHSTLNLKKFDKVWMQIYAMSPGVSLYDSDSHHTHFTGFMLQEEIVASL